jgi:tungstate transport system substrate-binding protein
MRVVFGHHRLTWRRKRRHRATFLDSFASESYQQFIEEMAIWKQAGIAPSGPWYRVTQDFMMATLKKANRVNGYFMTDSSTWVAGKKELGNLAVLFCGDPFLVNTNHGLFQPPGATDAQPYAEAFIRFLGSDEGQSILRRYGVDRFGEPMYNDAEYARLYEH